LPHLASLLLHGGELTPGEGARIGKVYFDTWFAANAQRRR
jgi:hypothetical protein